MDIPSSTSFSNWSKSCCPFLYSSRSVTLIFFPVFTSDTSTFVRFNFLTWRIIWLVLFQTLHIIFTFPSKILLVKFGCKNMSYSIGLIVCGSRTKCQGNFFPFVAIYCSVGVDDVLCKGVVVSLDCWRVAWSQLEPLDRASEATTAMMRIRSPDITIIVVAFPLLHTNCLHLCLTVGSYTDFLFKESPGRVKNILNEVDNECENVS